MVQEKEIKLKVLRIEDVNNVLSLLSSSLDLTFSESKNIIDTYFDHDDKTFFKLNHALRVRCKENKFELAYKTLHFIPKLQNNWFIFEKELSIPCSSKDMNAFLSNFNESSELIQQDLQIEDVLNLFEELGFKKTIIIDKVRYASENANFSVFVDDIHNLGLFVEIEVKDENDFESIVKKIPFDTEEFRFGYTNLYAKEILKMEIPDFNCLYRENPDWNYLEGQKEIIMEYVK